MKATLNINGLNDGQPSVFHSLYTLYYKALVSYACEFINDIDDAEDIVQSCFVYLYDHPVTFNNERAVVAYLYRAVKNSCLNLTKKQALKERYVKAVKEAPLEAEEELFSEEVYRLLFATIDELPKRTREVLLQVVEGKKNSEIAEILGISIETVKTHRKHGLAYLRERLNSKELRLLYLLIMVG